MFDDDIQLSELVTEFLVAHKYEVITKFTPEEGLDYLEKKVVDIIILDIVMPDIDGWTVYKKIKSTPLLSEIPIIIITIGDYHKMAEDFGVIDFLSKPMFLPYRLAGFPLIGVH